ncbi:hypothetical protein N5K37_32130 [Delftia tsuruhatensis]|uniref:hypothetical protein n=1 Tax=Delftia tsuruhatensis TaxID=180282 RepID=UPI002446E844|nr:hypothetical protein [Delftia tsuruhatensis]MDH2234565.1 hypothetical protein [Delftia tsuruhatensis]
MTATKIQPGDDTHLTLLMAPHSLNFLTGADRAALLAFGRDVFAAALDSKCLAQIEEPAGAAPAAVAPQGVVAWMHPETLDVIHADRKHEWATRYGIGGHSRAEGYTVALVRAGEPAAASPALEAPAAPATASLRAALDMFPIDIAGQSFSVTGVNNGRKLEADGDDTFFSKKKVIAFLTQLKGHLDALAAAPQAPAPAPGMAVTALAGEIIAALEADEKDGGYDLTSGLFGPKFSALVRRWAASEWASVTAPQAPAAPSAVATQVVESLLQLARIVNTAVEDWGETKEDDSLEVIFHKEEADKLEEILEFFDSLPDAPESEGVILSGPSRAARMLRAQAAPAAPAVDVETIEDAARFRAIVDAALTDDEAFDLALRQYPELGDDATIDDVRAMFDAARAAVAAQAKEGGDA